MLPITEILHHKEVLSLSVSPALSFTQLNHTVKYQRLTQRENGGLILHMV